jgi:hypothetical protein
LSVDAFHFTFTELVVDETSARPVGVVGAVWSGGPTLELMSPASSVAGSARL